MTDDWRPIETWTPEDGAKVLGYWHYYDQIGRLTEGWEIIERTEHGWEDYEGVADPELYTHFLRPNPLTRPDGVALRRVEK